MKVDKSRLNETDVFGECSDLPSEGSRVGKRSNT